MIWWLLLIAGILLFVITPVRRLLLIQPIYRYAKSKSKSIGVLEMQALEAGTSGFDAELFSGSPNWDRLRSLPKPVLTQEEQQFLDGPAKTLCDMIDDWSIRGVTKEIPDDIWSYIKKNRFIGLRVSKEQGGLGFSAQAQSIILGMIASRSFDVSIIVEVSNSLGPDELIEQYGTQQQKDKYLLRFRDGEEIPCFAITSQIGGSDVGSMRDIGVVRRALFEGQEVLGIELTFSKRYITLAPKATVVALAFHLVDPDSILGTIPDLGITLALIPAGHPGLRIGERHRPSGSAFPNGPVSGDKLFIPLSWVIGEREGVGRGWQMIMQCLAAGRAISLPSMSTAGTKYLLRTTTAYALIRRQFGREIGHLEGVQEVLQRMIEAAYVSESARSVTAQMLSATERPLVIASIMKHKLTEYARRSTNDALDIHAGKGIMDGPSNYLQSAYQIAPIGITVEGANILTRSLMITAQALLRAHPYFGQLVATLSSPYSNTTIADFERNLFLHVASFILNTVRALINNITGGVLIRGPQGGSRYARGWYVQVEREATTFAFIADCVLFLFQNSLKKKQRVAGRVSDLLSELYMMSCVLKRFEDDGAIAEDEVLVALCMTNALYRIQTIQHELIQNIPVLALRIFMRSVVFPFGRTKQPVTDKLAGMIVNAALKPGYLRDNLTRYIYIPTDDTEPVAQLERAFSLVFMNRELLSKFEKFMRSCGFTQDYLNQSLLRAQRDGVVSEIERQTLFEIFTLTSKISEVDSFKNIT
jgi:acyl-CoA dehydrogenase